MNKRLAYMEQEKLSLQGAFSRKDIAVIDALARISVLLFVVIEYLIEKDKTND